MTMLDRMRRHKGWLKWSLALVVLAFIVFYIPDFLDQGDTASPREVVARVGDQTITAGTFRRAYMAQLAAYQRAYGDSLNEQLLRQMGIEQQILQQLIDERAAVAEAERLGLRISDQEVAQRIYAMPAFQQDGVFAGERVYERVLQMQRPPLSKAEFEENLRRALLVDKLRAAVTDWVTVSEADVEREYRNRNEQVKLELAVFSPDRFRGDVTLADADLETYYTEHQERYRVPEQRKIRYLLIDTEALRATVDVPPAEIERNYRENIEQYSTPEQVRASHILLKTEGRDEGEVRTRAEEILKQVRGKADFAAVARKVSEDEGSAAQGGDLDYFGRGRMVPEFEEAAFALEPGQISDLVRSPFGFHIIRVADKRPATTRSLDEVRGQIAEELGYERAQQRADELAERLRGQIRNAADLDTAAQAHGLAVQESGFFGREEPIGGLGPAPAVADTAFTLGEGAVAGPVRVPRGQVFFATVESRDARVPPLDEVRDRVRTDATRERAAELARTRAQALAPEFAKSFGAAAKKAGVDVQTTELVARGSALPEVGVSSAVDAAVFELQAGQVSEPIATDAGIVVARVVERRDVKPEEWKAAADGLREELLNTQRGRFFQAYMSKARERSRAEINQDVVRRVVG
jgi:peptidyl-prolyl cis-trans isomerase D